MEDVILKEISVTMRYEDKGEEFDAGFPERIRERLERLADKLGVNGLLFIANPSPIYPNAICARHREYDGKRRPENDCLVCFRAWKGVQEGE